MIARCDGLWTVCVPENEMRTGVSGSGLEAVGNQLDLASAQFDLFLPKSNAHLTQK